MKIIIVFLAIIGLTFGEDSTLRDDLKELISLLPSKQATKLLHYYKNDTELRAIVTSEDFAKIHYYIMKEPEFQELSAWVSKYVKSNETEDEDEQDEQVEEINPEELAKYKPGWKGYAEAYRELYPTDKIISFIKQKVAEHEEFAKFWGKVKALVPVVDKVMQQPEFVEAKERLDAMGYEFMEKDIYQKIIDSV